MKKEVIITDACRTAIGSFGKSLHNIPAHNLGSDMIRELISKSNVNNSDIDEVIMGQVLTGGEAKIQLVKQLLMLDYQKKTSSCYQSSLWFRLKISSFCFSSYKIRRF